MLVAVFVACVLQRVAKHACEMRSALLAQRSVRFDRMPCVSHAFIHPVQPVGFDVPAFGAAGGIGETDNFLEASMPEIGASPEAIGAWRTGSDGRDRAC